MLLFSYRSFSLLVLLGVLFCAVLGKPPESKARVSRSFHLPFLGLGPKCGVCPPHFCDDDPAIIHGYCCGCARLFDYLPVKCANFIQCPLNGHGLCEDYEYMMSCCC